jgi:hypothetical protein
MLLATIMCELCIMICSLAGAMRTTSAAELIGA